MRPTRVVDTFDQVTSTQTEEVHMSLFMDVHTIARVDDSHHGIQQLMASSLISRLIDIWTPMWHMASGLSRRTSEGQAR